MPRVGWRRFSAALLVVAGVSCHDPLAPAGEDDGPPAVVTPGDTGATPVPDETTTKFRDPPLDRPESELIGEIYQNLLPGGDSPPMEVPPDSLLGPETRAFAAAAGLAPGDTIAIAAGTEGDELFPGSPDTPKDTEMLLRAVQPVSGGTPRYFNSSFYVAPSGAGVWATGTNRWAAYLDGDRVPANPKVERLTRVILKWMEAH